MSPSWLTATWDTTQFLGPLVAPDANSRLLKHICYYITTLCLGLKWLQDCQVAPSTAGTASNFSDPCPYQHWACGRSSSYIENILKFWSIKLPIFTEVYCLALKWIIPQWYVLIKRQTVHLSSNHLRREILTCWMTNYLHLSFSLYMNKMKRLDLTEVKYVVSIMKQTKKHYRPFFGTPICTWITLLTLLLQSISWIWICSCCTSVFESVSSALSATSN